MTLEERDEVLNILAKDNGLNLSEMFDVCIYINSKPRLASILHQMNVQYLLYKVGNEYYKPLSHIGSLIEQTELTTEKLKEKRINPPVSNGRLRKTGVIGGIALVAYLLRDKGHLHQSDFLDFVDISILDFYGIINRLILAGCVVKDTTNRRSATYKWSGKYKYPFPIKEESDIMLLQMTVEKWEYNRLLQL